MSYDAHPKSLQRLATFPRRDGELRIDLCEGSRGERLLELRTWYPPAPGEKLRPTKRGCILSWPEALELWQALQAVDASPAVSLVGGRR